MPTDDDEDTREENNQRNDEERQTEDTPDRNEGVSSSRENDNEQHPEATRNLRDRRNLQKPARFRDLNVDIEELFIAESQEPVTYEEAINSEDQSAQKDAMAAEMESLRKNETWRLVEPPIHAKILPNRWVFRYKPGINGRDRRFKARLVVKGFSQRPGVDYEETFSPVVKFGSIRSILAIAAASKMELVQFDVKTAYLNGDLTEDIYMAQPKGFKDETGRICKLQKSSIWAQTVGQMLEYKIRELFEEIRFKGNLSRSMRFYIT